jgi:hypothetical protein
MSDYNNTSGPIFLGLVILAIAVVAAAYLAIPRFEIAPAGENAVFRLDRRSGELCWASLSGDTEMYICQDDPLASNELRQVQRELLRSKATAE